MQPSDQEIHSVEQKKAELETVPAINFWTVPKDARKATKLCSRREECCKNLLHPVMALI